MTTLLLAPGTSLTLTGPDGATVFTVTAQAGSVLPPAPPCVVAFSQNDPRWAAQIYAGDATFARYGCFAVSVAMIASLVYAETLLPPDVARVLREAGAFSGANLSNPSRIPHALERLRWGGVMHWREEPANLGLIAAEIQAYGATICEMKWDPLNPTKPQKGNQHFVTVIGIDAGRDEATIVDPWDGEEKLLSQSRYAKPRNWRARQAITGIRMVRTVR